MWTIGRSQRVEEKNIDLSSVKYGTYIGKTFCQVWTHHKLVNTTQKLHFGVMVTEKSFWDKKLPLFVESLIYQ